MPVIPQLRARMAALVRDLARLGSAAKAPGRHLHYGRRLALAPLLNQPVLFLARTSVVPGTHRYVRPLRRKERKRRTSPSTAPKTRVLRSSSVSAALSMPPSP